MQINPVRNPRNRFLLFAFVLFSICAIPAGCKKEALPTISPNGMVIRTRQEDRTAPRLIRYVYKLVPAPFQPTDANIEVREVSDADIRRLSEDDPFRPAGYIAVAGLAGYTQLPGHDRKNPDNKGTTIFVVAHRDEAGLAHTIIHEWGHVVMWTILGEGERGEWGVAYSEAQRQAALAKGYELSGEQANFAEYFALWCARRAYPEAGNPPLPNAVQVYFDTLLSRRQ